MLFSKKTVGIPKRSLKKINVGITAYENAKQLLAMLSSHPAIDHIYIPVPYTKSNDDFNLSDNNIRHVSRQVFLHKILFKEISLLFQVDEGTEYGTHCGRAGIGCIELFSSKKQFRSVLPETYLKGQDIFLRMSILCPVAAAISLALIPFTKSGTIAPASVAVGIPVSLLEDNSCLSDERTIREVSDFFSHTYGLDVNLTLDCWHSKIKQGVFTTTTLYCDLAVEELIAMYKEFYNKSPFVEISEESVFLQQVIGSNHCLIHIEKAGQKLLVHSIIDDRLKGSSGQAIQLMNRLFRWEETLGLESFSPFVIKALAE